MYKNEIDLKNQGFSLIELSIVLIIIGLLVAGITGGASLIESARTRSFINELNGYKQSVYAFYVNKGRYPGDINMDGYIGICDGATAGCVEETYANSDFPSPYNDGNVNYISAPWVELYLENVIDFKPQPVKTIMSSSCQYVGSNFPYPKAFPSGCFRFFSYGDVSTAAENSFMYKMKQATPYLVLIDPTNTSLNKTKIFKAVDEKIDDGKFNYGNVRAYNLDYTEALNSKTVLSAIYYNVGL